MIRKYLKKKIAPLIQEIIYGAPLTEYEREMGVFVSGVQTATSGPIDEYILNHFRTYYSGHFHAPTYAPYRMKRISKVLEIIPPEEFEGKRVLELGGGIGYIGAFFAELGAYVLSLEGRATNRNLAALRYKHLENFKSVLHDLETDFTDFGKFDVVLIFAFLEVIDDIDHVLKCSMEMTDSIFVEARVCDSQDPHKIVKDEMTTKGSDRPINKGVSSCPSPAYIERVFQENGFSFTRYFTADLNTYSPVQNESHTQVFDWQHIGTERLNNENGANLRRFWHFHKA